MFGGVDCCVVLCEGIGGEGLDVMMVRPNFQLHNRGSGVGWLLFSFVGFEVGLGVGLLDGSLLGSGLRIVCWCFFI